MIPRTAGNALLWIRSHRTWPEGHCLQYVRSSFAVPSKYPSAIAAWNNAEHRHPGDLNPPAGVPVFYEGGQYGHIVFSAGAGTCWSTDAVAAGHVDKVGIEALGNRWNYRPLGWTEDLNGVRVWERPWIDLSGVKAAAKVYGKCHNGARLKRALAAEVGKGLMTVGDDRLGRRFRRRYRKWQRKLGYPDTGIPDTGSLTKLATRHGLAVRP